MVITFRPLTDEEKTIFHHSLSFWLLENQIQTLLNNYRFIVAEGRWRELFLTNQATLDILESSQITPYSVGLGFGEFKKNELILSLGGASIISELTNKKAVVSHKGEQAFLFRRGILCRSVLSINDSLEINDRLIVANDKGDSLGIGRLVISRESIQNPENKKQTAIKNLMDLGWYLRKGK